MQANFCTRTTCWNGRSPASEYAARQTSRHSNYPAQGRWVFTIHRIFAEGDQVVSDVEVTDGATMGRAITFSIIKDGKIVRQIEFWPEPFESPAWRAPWVERAQNKEKK